MNSIRPTFEDLDSISYDHAALSSQVTYVLALLAALRAERLEMTSLHAEVLRQTDILGSVLMDHIAYEEESAFPYLAEKYPYLTSRINSILTQHAEVVGAFNEFRSVLNANDASISRHMLLAKAEAFDTVFEQHATVETQLLQELRPSNFGNANSA